MLVVKATLSFAAFVQLCTSSIAYSFTTAASESSVSRPEVSGPEVRATEPHCLVQTFVQHTDRQPRRHDLQHPPVMMELLVREERERLQPSSGCSSYMSTTGCGWTSEWNCPGQKNGTSGPAGNDFSRGYACCCALRLWQQMTHLRPSPPETGEDPFFRPVSLAVFCVLVLITQGVVMFALQVILRNADQFAGNTEPSSCSVLVDAVAKTSEHIPTLCMMIVACRMNLLEKTFGLGEPPLHIRTAYIAATASTILVTLCLAVEERGPKALCSFAWSVRAVANFGLYIGCFGIASAVWSHGLPPTQDEAGPPPPEHTCPLLSCTILLCLAYFVVNFFGWLVRAGWFCGRYDTLDWVCLAAVIRKVPMLSSLFLALRLRFLTINPPYGILPRWQEVVACGLVVALYLEIFFVVIGREEKIKEEGDKPLFGADPILDAKDLQGERQESQQGCRCCLVLSHCVLLFFYAGVACSMASVCIYHDRDHHPMSTTSRCVFTLCALFFFVHALEWTSVMTSDVRGHGRGTWQDTLQAAASITSLCPLLAVLFIAARMRAMQVSQLQGQPQLWARDCMCACVFGLVLQVLCCVSLPLLTGISVTIDSDGNVRHEQKPISVAYVVAVLKFFSVFCIVGGSCNVAYSCYTITPERAMAHEPASSDLNENIRNCAYFIAGLMVAMLLSSAKVLGLVVKLGIESVPESVIGAKISIESAAISICNGYVNLKGLVVENPRARVAQKGGEPPLVVDNPKAPLAQTGGEPPIESVGAGLTDDALEDRPAEDLGWKSPHLLKVERCIVDINVSRLLYSFGRDFEIEKFYLHGLTVNFEQPLGRKSNVNAIKEVLAGRENKPPRPKVHLGSAPPVKKGFLQRALHSVSRRFKRTAEAEEGVEPPAELPVEESAQAPADDPPEAEEELAEASEDSVNIFFKILATSSICANVNVLGRNFHIDVKDIEEDFTNNGKDSVSGLATAVLNAVLKTVAFNAGALCKAAMSLGAAPSRPALPDNEAA